MKYKRLTLGQIEALINKLGGEEEVRNFLSGKFTFLKQEVEQKVRMLSKTKVFNFVKRSNYQDDPTAKGIIFLSDDNYRELFYSLIDEKFPELLENPFPGQGLNEKIVSLGDVLPTRIAQEISFIMQEKYPRAHKTYEWFFTNEDTRYKMTLSYLEERGSVRRIYLMNCYNLAKP